MSLFQGFTISVTVITPPLPEHFGRHHCFDWKQQEKIHLTNRRGAMSRSVCSCLTLLRIALAATSSLHFGGSVFSVSV